MVFADPKSVDADFIGKDSLVDNIAEDLRVGQRLAAGPDRDIAEGIQSEFEILWHAFSFALVRSADGWAGGGLRPQ